MFKASEGASASRSCEALMDRKETSRRADADDEDVAHA